MVEIKERPVCRNAILRMGLAPLLVEGVWDGRHAVHADGRRSSMSDSMRRRCAKWLRKVSGGQLRSTVEGSNPSATTGKDSLSFLLLFA